MSQRHPTARGRNANNDDRGTPVAAFDLDGTILWADAFTTFLRARVSRVEFWSRMAPLTPLFTAYVLSGEGRSRVKERFATAFLGGLPEAQVDAEADAFWAGRGRALLRADALAEVDRRQGSGHRVIIVTACPEIVVRPLARALGVELIGTRLHVENGRLTGRLDGENCRGPEKVARLEALCGAGFRLAAAYGDSTGDREMIARAEDGRMKAFRDGPPWALAVTIAMWIWDTGRSTKPPTTRP
jgi:phosphatidylglycerophosphatase C